MNLHVTGSNKKGEAYLVLTQGDVEETINLTGAFDSDIDLSRFVSGQISICLIYEDAGEVKVDVSLEIKKNESSEKSRVISKKGERNLWLLPEEKF